MTTVCPRCDTAWLHRDWDQLALCETCRSDIHTGPQRTPNPSPRPNHALSSPQSARRATNTPNPTEPPVATPERHADARIHPPAADAYKDAT